MPSRFRAGALARLAIAGACLLAFAARDGAGAQITAAVSLPGPSAIVAADQPFGRAVERAPEGRLWSKWRDILVAMATETSRVEGCRARASACDDAAALDFVALVDTARGLDGRDRLATVNRAVNDAIRFVTDLDQHGVQDRWSAPLVTLANRQGDCEDFAILKYAVLRSAGLPETDLRVVVVHDRWIGDVHAVLSVREGDRWHVLDNRWAEPRVDAALPRFAPLFTLAADGVSAYPENAVAPKLMRTAAR
ncbi:transglutaminase-like cysteine peptidase [Rhodoplanes azumiensis]|uniref:Transglutaminase-like cysteine peptidase n=1 Tax=Rhodoplanes azumiensis TaxID=1897628 RepID=A0ABW5AFT4_9BRAD